MLKRNLILALLISSLSAFGQSTVGLVAHWDMNGSTSDVSSNGHDGHGANITAAAGMYGIPNTAYYFNGVNSIITAPYLPDLNLSQYTICAIVNVQGFYSDLCQVNTIFERGKANSGAGSYSISFMDNPYDGGSCTLIDSTKDVFYCTVGQNVPSPFSVWQYSPQIVKNMWYKVVGTWDGTSFKIHINDTLKSIASVTGSPVGTSTDSIAIGMNLYEASAGYPYQFKGLIDDIRLYNRVLTDSEIAHYGDTCGRIISQPTTSNNSVGGTAIYTVSSSISAATYQWQQNAGTGFVNLSNAGPYSGVTTTTLTITGITAAMENYTYRCLVSNSSGCADTTSSALLTLGVNNITDGGQIVLYPNPAKNTISVGTPFINTQGTILLMNELGQTVMGKSINGKITDFDLSNLSEGIYIFKIQCEEQVFYKKFIKY